jgi:hypothetical protein
MDIPEMMEQIMFDEIKRVESKSKQARQRSKGNKRTWN